MLSSHVKASLPCVIALMIAGSAFSLWTAQTLWLESSDSRAESYAKAILKHSESIATNLTEALADLEKIDGETCSPQDFESMRKIAFSHQFVKDAGRIDGRKILCSAFLGSIPKTYMLEGDVKTTKNKTTLWTNVPSYAFKGSNIDITSKKDAFVVTSPNAFSIYENPNIELSAIITSLDGHLLMRKIGGAILPKETASTRKDQQCSETFDICVTTQIRSNMLSLSHIKILTLLVLLGSTSGFVLWIAINQAKINRKSIKSKFLKALKNKSIKVAYQPIVRMNTGVLCGIEALARWSDRELGDIPPDTFVQIASETNTLEQLSDHIIKTSMRDCKKLLASNKNLYLSLNLDCEYLVTARTESILLAEAAANGINTRQIALEILESSTTEIKKLESAIFRLRGLGFLIFIDDFGTGYSSLAYLGTLKVDKIKIDRGFTQAADTHTPAAMILSKIIEIANSINTLIIFEGLETSNQKQAILNIFPQALAQGWLYSKATPIEGIKLHYENDD